MSTRKARSGSYVPVQSSPFVSSVVSIAEAYPSVGSPNFAESARELFERARRITQVDRAVIRGYLHECCLARAAAGAQDKLQGAGLQRPWMPGRKLPPGFWPQSLPAELECKLSTVPAGHARLLVDHNVLLVEMASREIVDVMRNACATDGLGRCVAREGNHAPGSIDRSVTVLENSSPRSQFYERVANS